MQKKPKSIKIRILNFYIILLQLIPLKHAFLTSLVPKKLFTIHDIPLIACLYNFGYSSNWNYESKIRISKFIERISWTKWSNINNLM